jgi:hypothetical protein
MVKKNLKNKYKNIDDSENDEECIQDNHDSDVFTINESFLIIQKLTSNNYSDRENITSLLASHDFNPLDEKMRDQLLNSEICKILVSKLSDPFLQVRFNTISAIMNLIICYSEHDIDKLFFFDAGLLKGVESLLFEYFSEREANIKHSEGEQIKINKIIKGTVDLLLLTMDLYDNDENKSFEKLHFNSIIKFIVEIILNPESLSEEIIINSCLFLANLVSLKVIKAEEFSTNNLNKFIEFSVKLVLDKTALKSGNSVVIASIVVSLFYIYCNNYSYFNNPELIKYLIETIYNGINFDLGTQIEDLNVKIQNFIKNADKDEMVVENKSEDSTSSIKEQMKKNEYNIRSTLLYLKTFTDVINSAELGSLTKNEQTLNTSFHVDEDDDSQDEEVEPENNLEIETNISFAVHEIFKNSNYSGLFTMIKNEFLPNLVKFFDNLTIEEFLLNDFDKMIVIKELLFDLEYFTVSLINNIIQNFDNLFHDNLNIIYSIGSTINKRIQISEYSKNTDFLSVLLTCLRTILEKYKSSFNNNFHIFDYKSLFLILNNNISDSFIKINIIDIINFIFCEFNSKEDNYEVCKLLYNICVNENDMEVTSHVLNAYFDIYKEDDYETNSILKQIGVIDLMKLGTNEFKIRVNYFNI